MYLSKKEIRREIRSLRKETSRLMRKARWEVKNGNLKQGNLSLRVVKKKQNKDIRAKGGAPKVLISY